MRFTTDILTPLTAFCLFGSGSDLAAQEKQFNPLIVEQSTAGEAAANAVFVGMQFNEQAGDREVNRVSTPGKGARSTAAA